MGCTHSGLGDFPIESAKIFDTKISIEKTDFSVEQIELIRASWKSIGDKTEFGKQIMIRQVKYNFLRPSTFFIRSSNATL
jgi:hypothetical protein